MFIESLEPIKTLFNTSNFEDWYLNAHKILAKIDSCFEGRGKGFIDADAFIHPTAVLEDEVIIGKNVSIGPFSYIRKHSIILSGTKIGCNVEIIKSIVMQNSKISHMSCIGRSVIGSNCNLGAGFIAATRRLNGKEIEVKVPAKPKFISKRRHLGVVVGMNVQTGVYVITMPGSTIGENSIIYPQSTIFGYVKPGFIGYINAKWKK